MRNKRLEVLVSRDTVRFTSAAMVPGEGCTVTMEKVYSREVLN